jgi:hypothetical protein
VFIYFKFLFADATKVLPEVRFAGGQLKDSSDPGRKRTWAQGLLRLVFVQDWSPRQDTGPDDLLFVTFFFEMINELTYGFFV